MRATTIKAQQTWRRLAWFGALWLGGVATVAALAYGLRAIIKAVS
jgi:hypothetical protein